MATTIFNRRTALAAGFLYLGVVLTGIFSLMYVPSTLIVWDNAALTYQQIIASETLFRCWIVAGLLCYTFFLFLPLVLYRLLQSVNQNQAKLMLILALMSVPVFFLNAQQQFSVLTLINDTDGLAGYSAAQKQLQVMLYLFQYDNGMRIVHVFSGLWLFPFGCLVFKSGFLPRILGVLLVLGGIGYLVNFLGHTLSPAYTASGIDSYVRLPASVGEIGICCWLLFAGMKRNPPAVKEPFLA